MLLTIIVFILVLGLLVFIHELGHFVTAKRAGIKVEEFGLGFPPKLFGIKRGETMYSLNWIPLGGFVRIKGEDGMSLVLKVKEELEKLEKDEINAKEKSKVLNELGEFLNSVESFDLEKFKKFDNQEKIRILTEKINNNLDDPRSFINKPKWQRAVILSAGVIMNVVLTVVLFSIGFGIGLPQALDEDDLAKANIRDQKIQIVEVVKDSPAANAGFEMGDAILNVDGENLKTEDDLINYLDSKAGLVTKFHLQRMDKEVDLEVTPVVLEETGKGGVGIGVVRTGIVSYPWYEAVFRGVVATIYLGEHIIIAFFNLFKDLIITQEVAVDVAGPVGIAVMTGQVAHMGFVYILQFTALLSLNLAIINFLPFPALDGGRVLFLIIEAIRRKPINRQIENLVHNIGFALLMVLILVVTYKDIMRFSDKFVKLWGRIF